jgi:hypothetical protein
MAGPPTDLLAALAAGETMGEAALRRKPSTGWMKIAGFVGASVLVVGVATVGFVMLRSALGGTSAGVNLAARGVSDRELGDLVGATTLATFELQTPKGYTLSKSGPASGAWTGGTAWIWGGPEYVDKRRPVLTAIDGKTRLGDARTLAEQTVDAVGATLQGMQVTGVVQEPVETALVNGQAAGLVRFRGQSAGKGVAGWGMLMLRGGEAALVVGVAPGEVSSPDVARLRAAMLTCRPVGEALVTVQE